jgi:2-iminoacetate synthase ThiH
MQGGINPTWIRSPTGRASSPQDQVPDMHVHAFSPMEIMYGARRTQMDYPSYFAMLRDAGLGSIPGTAAEILDDEVREILSHKKVDVRTWIEIITTAPSLGVPTTSTVMYGHIETPDTSRGTSTSSAASRRRRTASPSSSRSASSGRTRKLYHDGKVTPHPKGPPRPAYLRRVAAHAARQHRPPPDLVGEARASPWRSSRCAPAATTSAARSWRRASRAKQVRTPANTHRSKEISALVTAMGRRPVQRTTLYQPHGSAW